MISPRRVLARLSLAAAIATVGACTTGQAAAQPAEPAVGAISTVHSGADIVLPLDAYMMTPQQQHTLIVAVTTIGRDCMKRFGLAWPVNPPAASSIRPRNDLRYGIIDPEKAKTSGYHPPPAASVVSPTKTPTPEAMNVWAGKGQTTFGGRPVPVDGCAGEAMRQLGQGAPPADAGIPERLQLQTFASTRADSRTARMFADWSGCMREQGFDYPDPYAAGGDARWRHAPGGRPEIAVATADAACNTRTNLAGRMLAVETAYQERAIAQHATELAAVKAFLDREFANAGTVAAASR